MAKPMISRTVTFTFELDASSVRTWTVTSDEAPGAYGVHAEPYEALLDCAYMLFNGAENPESVAKEDQPFYHQLNLDFCPFFDDNEEDEEEEVEERILSPAQIERARRLAESWNG